MSQTPKHNGSTLVAAGIFLSRIAGIVRTVAMAAVLGSSAAADAFAWAMRIPNVLQNLLGEGSLSASFIPVYARMVEEGDERKASALAGSIVSLLLLATGTIVLIGVLAARPIVWLLSDWQDDPVRYELAIELFRITTVGIGFLVLSAWCLGVLNSHRSFFLSYVAPVIWNLAQIATLVVVGLLAWSEADIAVAVAWAVVPAAAAVIDRINVLEATRGAMAQAVARLSPAPDCVLVDAVALPAGQAPSLPLVRADGLAYAVACASILAKVVRDDWMVGLDGEYPQYGFAGHKGYGAPEHIEALAAYGPTPEHRLTFRSVLPRHEAARA